MKQPDYPNLRFARSFGSLALIAIVVVQFIPFPVIVAALGYLPFLACVGYRVYYSFRQRCYGYGWIMILAGLMMIGVFIASYIFYTKINQPL